MRTPIGADSSTRRGGNPPADSGVDPHAESLMESHVDPHARPRGKPRADEGSGTIVGVALIMLVAVLMSSVAVAGRLLTVRAAARSAADLAALSAAVALRDGAADPCAVAGTVASAHAGNLASCTVGGELGGDVTVSVGIDTQVPFMPHIAIEARAGPVPCSPSGTP